MSNIAALGDASSVLLFKAIGASVFEAKTEIEAIENLRQIIIEDYELLFITEDIQPLVQPVLDENPEMVYLFIPPIRGATGTARKYLEDIIQKTVGVKH
ncbi:hypothetical protein LCGC14_0553100 [marine sediment metagenome]|uniref:V-type ATP synthase subunit F n=1 Tax=marine sediment metagenome TaxID=412755 RepID=A0A0F9UAN9_9ZZZZ